MNKENVRKLVEEDLSNYPFWLLSEEVSGLGSPTRWDKGSKGYSGTSSVEHSVMQDQKILWKISIIEAVLDRLDAKSKRIIEERYFRCREEFCINELTVEMDISKTKFYGLRNKALDKFAIALRYLK